MSLGERPIRTASRSLAGILLALALAGSAFASDPPKISIKVNFDSKGKFTESCGTTGTASASGMSATQKAAAIAKAQKKYDDALGAGKVNVSEGTGGDVNVVVNGGKAPGDLEGTEYGDAGQDWSPAVVHEGEFTAAGFSGTDLSTAIGETIAHEAAHRLGLDHNWDDPPSLMTEGSKVSDAQRKADARSFTADDTKKLKGRPKSTASSATGQKNTFSPNELGTLVGMTVGTPLHTQDDQCLDSYAALGTAPPLTEFGWISLGHEFVFEGDNTNTPLSPTFMSFLYHGSTDIAVRVDGFLYPLSQHWGNVLLSDPNPDNPNAFLHATVLFNTPSGIATVELDAIMDPASTGGFVGVCTNPAATSTTLGSSSNPSTCGAPIDLTAQVVPLSGTGQVDFFDGATPIGSAEVMGGVATLSYTPTEAGPHSLTASYLGDACLARSSSNTVSQSVDPASSQASVSGDVNPAPVGSKVTLTAQIDHPFATGQVNFYDGATPIGTATLVDGSASLSISTLPVGSHPVSAAYGGDACYGPATSPAYDEVITPPSGVTGTLPTEFALGRVWPSPVMGEAEVAYDVPVRASIRLSLLDLQGRRVAVLAEGETPAGRYVARLDARALRLAAGVYFLEYRVPGRRLIGRISVLE